MGTSPPLPSTATPAPLPPSPGPWESSPSAEGSWPKGWGPVLPHNRAIQPGGCQPCSACCPQDSLVRGSLAPGEWRVGSGTRSAQPGPCPPLPTTQPHFPSAPHWAGGDPRPSAPPPQLSEMGQLSPCCSLLNPQWKPDYNFLFLFPPCCGCLSLLLPLGQGLSIVCTAVVDPTS